MPTTYAHYRFGKRVCKLLPDSIRNTIESYGGLYDLGLHGPDILFYYKALTKNPVSQTGFAMHKRPGQEFFEPALLILREFNDKEPALAYLYGFLCHFALDSVCHPYVEHMVRKSHVTHSAIEAEFDRMLMEQDGLNPLTFRPAAHLVSCPFYAKVISPFFPTIGIKKIRHCLWSIRFYCNMLAVPGWLRRSLIYTVLRIGDRSHTAADMVIRHKKIPACEPMCLELKKRCKGAEALAVELIENFHDCAFCASSPHAALDTRLEHTFGEH